MANPNQTPPTRSNSVMSFSQLMEIPESPPMRSSSTMPSERRRTEIPESPLTRQDQSFETASIGLSSPQEPEPRSGQPSQQMARDPASDNAQLRPRVNNLDYEKSALQTMFNSLETRLDTVVQERDDWQEKANSFRRRLESEINRNAQLEQQLDQDTRPRQSNSRDIHETYMTVREQCDQLIKELETTQDKLKTTRADLMVKCDELTQLQAPTNVDDHAHIRSSPDSDDAVIPYADDDGQSDAPMVPDSAPGSPKQSERTNQRMSGVLIPRRVPQNTYVQGDDSADDETGDDEGLGLLRRRATTVSDDAGVGSHRQRKRGRVDQPTPDAEAVSVKRVRRSKATHASSRHAQATASPSQSPNDVRNSQSLQTLPTGGEYIAIDDLRIGSSTIVDIPTPLLHLIRDQMAVWDRIRPDWVAGTKKGKPKCAHRFANRQGSMGEGSYACHDCVMNRRVCLAVRENMVQIRPRPPEDRGPDVTEVDLAFWVDQRDVDIMSPILG
ncbi:MAG: hypothetical protein Q9168_002677 [Polycauliona sp. 1 TL-2023]